MVDLTDTNPNNPETYKTLSGNISKMGVMFTMLRIGGRFINVLTGLQVAFEMMSEGPVKGFISGAANVFGGAFGMGVGFVGGAKEAWSTAWETGNPLNLINPMIYLMNMYKYSNQYGDLADSYADKGCDVITNYFKNLFNQPAKQPQCPASPLDFVQAEKFLNENSSTPLQDAINDRINLTDMLNQGNQSFLESLGFPDMQKQYGFLSVPAYGLSYAHFNTTQNDPMDNDFVNSLLDPYGVLSGKSIYAPPPIITLNPEVETLISQGYSDSKITSEIDNYINGNNSNSSMSDLGSAIANSSSSGGSGGGGGDDPDNYDGTVGNFDDEDDYA